MSDFTPKTRLEKFLAKIAGRSEEELEPKTRLEAALDDIAENVGQGGGSSGGGVFLVDVNITQGDNYATYTLTKTYREVKDAGFAVIIINMDSETIFAPITTIKEENGLYTINNQFETDDIDGYPSYTIGGDH